MATIQIHPNQRLHTMTNPDKCVHPAHDQYPLTKQVLEAFDAGINCGAITQCLEDLIYESSSMSNTAGRNWLPQLAFDTREPFSVVLDTYDLKVTDAVQLRAMSSVFISAIREASTTDSGTYMYRKIIEAFNALVCAQMVFQRKGNRDGVSPSALRKAIADGKMPESYIVHWNCAPVQPAAAPVMYDQDWWADALGKLNTEMSAAQIISRWAKSGKGASMTLANGERVFSTYVPHLLYGVMGEHSPVSASAPVRSFRSIGMMVGFTVVDSITGANATLKGTACCPADIVNLVQSMRHSMYSLKMAFDAHGVDWNNGVTIAGRCTQYAYDDNTANTDGWGCLL